MSKKDELDCLNAVKKWLLSKRIDKKLLKCFSTAKVNEKTTEFPDFICDGGFIEHFQVSAAKGHFTILLRMSLKDIVTKL